MNKHLITGIIFIAAGVILLIINFNNKKASKELELTYKTNGGVPYKWEYTIEDEEIVKFVKSYEVENQNTDGRVGAPIKTAYVFTGLKEGSTTITFKYVSIVDGKVDKEEVTKVKVDKSKKITVIS